MSVTYAQVAPHLKEYYHDNNLELWATVGNPKISPLIARLQVKNMVENAAGKGYVIPVSTARGSAASVTFSVSQGISSGSAVGNSVIRKAWTVLPKTYNLTAKWDREAILAASNPDALFDVMKDEINARIEKGRLRAAIALLEDGYGRVATITSAPTSTVTTSPNAESCTTTTRSFLAKSLGTCSTPMRFTGKSVPPRWRARVTSPVTGACTRW